MKTTDLVSGVCRITLALSLLSLYAKRCCIVADLTTNLYQFVGSNEERVNGVDRQEHFCCSRVEVSEGHARSESFYLSSAVISQRGHFATDVA